MTKQKIKPKDFMFIKFFKEQFGAKFVDDKGKEIEFEPTTIRIKDDNIPFAPK